MLRTRLVLVCIVTAALAASLVVVEPAVMELVTDDASEAAADPAAEFRCGWWTQPPTWGPAIGNAVYLNGRWYYCALVHMRPAHLHKWECRGLVLGANVIIKRLTAGLAAAALRALGATGGISCRETH